MNVARGRDFDDELRELGPQAIRDALDGSRYPWPDAAPYDDEQVPAARVKATPFVWRAEADIPPRRWLYGRHLIRKYLSLDIAAGGVGKSSVKIGEALAMASGKDIYGNGLGEGALSVWIYNLEDPAEETEKRIHATAKRFSIAPGDVVGRLYTDSGRDNPLVLATEDGSGCRIARPVVDSLIAELQERKIDVLIIDPFVSSHQVSENNNMAIDMVAKEWARIADICNCSINLVHHIRKTNGTEVTAESSRGAVSLIGAARSVHVYNRMTDEEADKAGIDQDEARFIFRVSNDKANLAPPSSSDWFRMNNVDLDNGDKVGVACPWKWPNAFAGVTEDRLREIQKIIGGGEYRDDVRSPNWAGRAIGSIVGKDPHDQREKNTLSMMIREWVKNGVLAVEERQDRERKTRRFIVVGEWIR